MRLGKLRFQSHPFREKKGKGKPFCYRCHTKGHTISECNVPISCDICYGDHVTKICPNLKYFQNTVIPCDYAVEGLGFYFIPAAENPKQSTEEKTAMVRVLEGSLLLSNWQWNLKNFCPARTSG